MFNQDVPLNSNGGMKINDTVNFFMENYEPCISFLRRYYQKFPSVFSEYFAYHCKDTEERHLQSIIKYPKYFKSIKEVHHKIIPIINEITEEYNKLYHVSFPIEVNLIVGGFGSNAYTHRQIIPNITFSLEKLSPVEDHLRTIVAHEFGHAAHNIMSNNARIDWGNIQWNSPLTWLNQEGAAIHFSRRIVLNLQPSIYFSFDNNGGEWLEFCCKNMKKIKNEFAKDYIALSPELIFREWFSINGGEKFGFNRLAYYISNAFFQNQIQQLGEYEAIIAWKNKDFINIAEEWLM